MRKLVLEFIKDEVIIEQDRRTIMDEMDSVIGYSYLVMPTKFSYGMVDFLKVSKDSWMPLSIIDVAISGFDTIKALKGSDFQTYYLPDIGSRIDFAKMDEGVLIVSRVNGQKAIVDYEELVNVFFQFTKKVKKLLSDELPEIKCRQYWRDWIGNIE